MPQTGADLFTTALEQYGVTHVFGNPGTTEIPIMEAISQSNLEYILGLHEDVAVGMAAGYAKTRLYHASADPAIQPVGVVNLHVAPGVAHGLGNIFDSSLIGTGAPIVVTAGMHPTDHQYREPNLGADLVSMTEEFTKWSAEVATVSALPTMLRRAFRVAMTPPTGPVFLSLPLDVMIAETTASPERLGAVSDAGAGDPDAIESAATALENAQTPVMVVGDLVGRSGPAAVSAAGELATTLGMRSIGEFAMSEVSFPPNHELWFDRLPRDQEPIAAFLDGDVIVFAGVVSNTPTNPPKFEFIPDDATTIHISDYAWEIGKNYATDIGIIGDTGRILHQLSTHLVGAVPDDIRADRYSTARDLKDQILPDPDDYADPTDPRASNLELAAAMATVAPDARVVGEAPTSSKAIRHAYDFEPGQFFYNRGGGLGYGLPAAIGSAIAEQHAPTDPRDVIGVIGDGSYLYYPQALYTAARYDIDITIVIPDNRNYRILKNNTLRILGGDESDYEFVGMDFEPPVDIPANAKSHGATGTIVPEQTDIEDELTAALAQSGPTVLDILIHD